MQLTKTTIGVLLGLGLLAGACGGDDQPSSPAARQPSPPAAERPSAPAAQRSAPAPGQQQAAAAASPAEQLRKQLAPAYPEASPSQIDCLSNGVAEQLGQDRFAALVAIRLQEKAGGRPESARGAKDAADFEKLATIVKDCGLQRP